MTTITRNTIVGTAVEVTEGTYVAPIAADVFHIVDLPGMNPAIENLDRGVFKGSIGKQQPIKGIHSGTLEIKTEMRAGGVTATLSDLPDWDRLMKSAMGAQTTAASTNSTTVAGSTTTVINVDTGDGANHEVGQLVLILGEARFVIIVAGDVITLNEPLVAGAPGSGVTVFAGHGWKPKSEDHDSLSITVWQDAETSGKEFRATGCRCSNLSIEDFTVGQLPRLTFTFEMLDFDEVIGTTVASPVFLAQLPAAVIQGRATRADATIKIGTLELEMAQTISKELDINIAGGVAKMFITSREMTGSINPFVDQTTVTFFTAWTDNTTFEMFFLVGQRDSGGLLVQGSVVAIYMPQTLFTEYGKEDLDGSLVHSLAYMLHELATGTGDDEMFIGVV